MTFSSLRLPPSSSLIHPDELFMFQALKEAWKAFDEEEVPVGAVVVFEGKVISRAHNQTEQLQDATAHAEMLALGGAAAFLGNWRLQGCTLYSTLEPCIMCAGAMILSRLEKVVWGAPDIRHGANGSLIDLFQLHHPIHQVQVASHLLEEWCRLPMKRFFQEKRQRDSIEE